MQTQLDIPIILRRVGIGGPAGVREIDVILDTGAVYTVIAWDVAKDIGYDPAASERRMPIVTANGVIEAPLITVRLRSLTLDWPRLMLPIAGRPLLEHTIFGQRQSLPRSVFRLYRPAICPLAWVSEKVSEDPTQGTGDGQTAAS